VVTEPVPGRPGSPGLPLPEHLPSFATPPGEPIPDSFSFDRPRDPHWYKRAVFYFATGDSQVEKFLDIPNRNTPGVVRDVEFRFCGRKMAGAVRYEEWLETVPDEFRKHAGICREE